MPAIEVSSEDRKKVRDIVEFVKRFMADLSVEGRFVLTIEMLRLLDPEIQELKRKHAKSE